MATLILVRRQALAETRTYFVDYADDLPTGVTGRTNVRVVAFIHDVYRSYPKPLCLERLRKQALPSANVYNSGICRNKTPHVACHVLYFIAENTFAKRLSPRR
jgi:hypothetical protein